jgi:hypothetical protein
MDEEAGRTAEGVFVGLVTAAAFWMLAYLLWHWLW